MPGVREGYCLESGLQPALCSSPLFPPPATSPPPLPSLTKDLTLLLTQALAQSLTKACHFPQLWH